MTGPHRIYGSNQTTSASDPRSERLTIDKLVPVAVAGAPHLGARMLFTEKSKSSGDARIVEAETQPDSPAANALPAEDVSTRFGSTPLSRWSMVARTCNTVSSRTRRNPSSIEPEPSRV